MKKLVSTKNLSKEEWLRYRKKYGIGGSEAGAICGFNPYRSIMQIYYDKISDEIDETDNEAMCQGRDLEEYVARRFMEATGKKVRRANTMFYDPENPFMLADVDRIIVGENAGLEIKTASPYTEAQWSDGKVPLSYQMQCFHYMSVTGADAWYVAVLIYGREFKYYRIERDEEIIRHLVQIEKDFWENHVLKRIPPNPDGSEIADKVIAEQFKKSQDISIPLSGFNEKLQRREEVMELLDKLSTEKNQIEQELKLYMGEAERAENEKYLVSWKSVITNRIDTKLLKAEQPDIFKKYQRESQSRRFTIKAA